MKIYLVGFMGCGKTSIGKRIAKKLRLRFVDMDDLIEEIAGMTIPELFEAKGEEGFREVEKQVLHDTFSQDNLVVATGGGAPCFFDNMEQINQNGYSFYLRNSVDFFVDKLMNSNTVRPLVLGKTEEELRDYIEETLGHREQFYLKSSYSVTIGNIGKSYATRLISEMVRTLKKAEKASRLD